jgi:curved DNA-binding protein CbpA
VVPGPDPYKILQVDPEAEDEVIQAAYRRLAQKYHPDRSVGQEASDRMVAINGAWGLIGTPERRAAYDRGHLRGGASGAGPAPRDASSATARPTSTGRRSSGASHGAGGQAAGGTSSRPPEQVSRDWTTGRSDAGHGYDPTMRAPDGLGAAGPPPGNPSGSVLTFGRYAAWSLGEIARADIDYVEWLDRMPIGRPYRDEIDAILRRAGRRQSAAMNANERRGLFRRR